MPRRNEPTERRCIVTQAVRPTSELLRFVLDPAGEVVADLRHKLPGRGVWVTANAAHVATAEQKRLFGRAFKAQVTVAPGLAERVAEQLRASALGALSLARKAGELVLGFAKVEAAIGTGRVLALVEASDAGADGLEKLERAASRSGTAAAPIRIVRTFNAEEMGLALGRAHVIHAALLAGRAGAFVLHQIDALARFLDEVPQHGGEPRPLTDIADPSAEHQSV
ncbi:MAG: RNA-binding protein [Bauldia sp.]